MRTEEEEQRRRGRRPDQSLVWVGAGVAVALVGVLAFLTFFSGTFFGAALSFFFLFWVVSWFFRPWLWGWGWGYRRRYPWWWRYDGASEILRERYARGEITKQQFEEMMRDLERHS